jgi:hypothetical protein
LLSCRAVAEGPCRGQGAWRHNGSACERTLSAAGPHTAVEGLIGHLGGVTALNVCVCARAAASQDSPWATCLCLLGAVQRLAFAQAAGLLTRLATSSSVLAPDIVWAVGEALAGISTANLGAVVGRYRPCLFGEHSAQ